MRVTTRNLRPSEYLRHFRLRSEAPRRLLVALAVVELRAPSGVTTNRVNPNHEMNGRTMEMAMRMMMIHSRISMRRALCSLESF